MADEQKRKGIEAWAREHKGAIGIMAALAAGLGALFLLFHPKGQQAAQSAISYIPTATGGGGSAGGSSSPLPPVPPVPTGPPPIKATFTPGTSGFTVWNGVQYAWRVSGPGESLSQIANKFWPGSNNIGELQLWNPNATSDAFGNTLWIVPTQSNAQIYGGQTPPDSLAIYNPTGSPAVTPNSSDQVYRGL